MPLVAAIDVGTASARAGIFDATDGTLLGRADAPLDTHAEHGRPLGSAEQSSSQIWHAAAEALRGARAEAAARADAIACLAFDATASLVLLDAAGRPLSASPSGEDHWNVIPWHDHRAIVEAAACTATAHPALAGLGGAMHPEMPLPKLLWLKQNLPDAWARAAYAFDLSDFLSFRATGNPARSHVTLACKWTWSPGTGWNHDFLARIGLADLAIHTGQPDRGTPVGTDLGPLTAAAAADLGLSPATRVAAGLIDGHAGTLGVLGHCGPAELETDAALVAGTSTAIMAMSPTPRPGPGIWGPHHGGALPGLYLTEVGQSASGALLDHILSLHGLAPTAESHARVVARVQQLRRATPDLAPDLHVRPDFHGRRTPVDPRPRGAMTGLSIDAPFDALAMVYWRTCVGLSLDLRRLLDHLAAHGSRIATLHLAGGHAHNPLLLEVYPDATGRRLVVPATDAVLLGTAIAAAVGAACHPTLAAAATAMRRRGTVREPTPSAAGRYDRDWQAFNSLSLA